MKFNGLTVAYSEKFLDWQLGEDHEVNPIRALVLVEKLKILQEAGICVVDTSWDKGSVVEKAKWVRAIETLQPDKLKSKAAADPLYETELLMFGATYHLTEKLIKDRVFDGGMGVYFNPAGGEISEQHTDVDVFNDLAWACLRLKDSGMNVVYIDWDAHHCYETETLLKNSGVTTFSVHEARTAGTTYTDLEGEGFANYGMDAGASDYGLVNAVAEIIDTLENEGKGFDVIVLNTGADGLGGDPTSGLDWTIDGYGLSSKMLGDFAQRSSASLLVGGGGTTLPVEGGPDIWSAVLGTLTLELLNLELLV